MKRTSKIEKELMDSDNSEVIAGRRRWVEVEKGIRGIDSNEKVQ